MWCSALKVLLIFLNLGLIGCGVKGAPVPYVSTLPPSPSPIPVVTALPTPVPAEAEKKEALPVKKQKKKKGEKPQ